MGGDASPTAFDEHHRTRAAGDDRLRRAGASSESEPDADADADCDAEHRAARIDVRRGGEALGEVVAAPEEGRVASAASLDTGAGRHADSDTGGRAAPCIGGAHRQGEAKIPHRFLILAALVIGPIACSDASEPPPKHVTPQAITGDIPCAPNRVLVEICQQCHSSPPRHGAPFSLVTYADVQREQDGKPVWQWMGQYVRDGNMPLPPIHIADDDRATLLAWLQAGAPSSTPSATCTTVDAGTSEPATADTSTPPEDTYVPAEDTRVEDSAEDDADTAEAY
jgi:hypothetical protein